MEDAKFAQLINYMRTHWPSQVKPEWQVADEEYPEIVDKIVRDFTINATRNRQFFRICGQSGSGKTSQLLPAVEKWLEVRRLQPVLIGARLFVPYHPHAKEIEAEYGAENLRKMTDEVSTILMFLTLKALIEAGFDIVLDVTLLDPIVEGVLMGLLSDNNYQTRMMMVAVSKEISDQFIAKRAGRVVAKSTADEFWRVIREALEFYAMEYKNMPFLAWSAWGEEPVFDGVIGDGRALSTVEKYWQIYALPGETDEDGLRAKKIEYLSHWEG